MFSTRIPHTKAFLSSNTFRCLRISASSSSEISSGSLCEPLPTDFDDIVYDGFSFEIKKRDERSKARLGFLTTPHGTVMTPAFVFCATKAAIRGVTTDALEEAKTQGVLSNTYHLMLTPGAETVHAAGGLHRFMKWSGPMLTDSGGFQIFSMGHGSVSDEIKGRRRAQRHSLDCSTGSDALSRQDKSVEQPSLLNLTEHGASFRSYIDGVKHTLTPELSIDIQHKLGADLIVVFDECTPYRVNSLYTELSMLRSHRWALRSLRAFKRIQASSERKQQALYGIVQVSNYCALQACRRR
jgi:queuine tRNA-ribosyltransferase